MSNFVKDRDEALLSLDKDKIFAYLKKYGIFEYPVNEEVFWAGMHKARSLASDGIPREKLKR